MEHIPECDLIELAGGQLDDQRRPAVEEHLLDCADCRGRFRQLRRTWRVLGDWQVSAGGRDLWPAIQADLARRPRRALPLWRWLLSVSAAAVAILLAAAIGHVAARLGPLRRAPAPAAVAKPDERAVARSLALHALADSSPGGIADAVLNATLDDGEEPQ